MSVPGRDADRRSYRRLKSNLLLRVEKHEDHEAKAFVASDISLGGVFIEVIAPYPQGTEVELEFSLPDAEATVSAVGTVVWEDPGIGMGIEFTSMSTTSRSEVQKYIQKSTDKNTNT